MPKDDSFYIDYTNRVWARWERENELAFYDPEEEARHEHWQEERERSARFWASRRLERERETWLEAEARRGRLHHPSKPLHCSDDEDDITVKDGKHIYRLRAPLTAIDPANPQIPSRLNPGPLRGD